MRIITTIYKKMIHIDIGSFFKGTFTSIVLYKNKIKIKVKELILNNLSQFKSFLEHLTGYKWFQFQDALIIASLSLCLFKAIIFIFLDTILPFYNLGFLFFSFLISLKYNFIFKFREYIFVPFLQYFLGHNFYRHDVYGPIDDLELRDTNYEQNLKGTIQFWTKYCIEKITRGFYICLIAIRLSLITNPLLSILIQQSLLLLLIINKNIIVMLILVFIINISKIAFLLSDITISLFYKNLFYELQVIIKEDEKIKFSYSNIKYLTMWSVRTLESRDLFLRVLYYESGYAYMLEKVEIHKIKKELEKKKKIKNKIIKISIIIFLIIAIIIIIYIKYNYKELNLTHFESFFLGFLKNNSSLNKYPIMRKALGHYCGISYIEKEDFYEIKIYAYSTSILPLHLSHQSRVPITHTFSDNTKHTTIPTIPINLKLKKSDFEELQQEIACNNKHVNPDKLAYFSEVHNSKIANDIRNINNEGFLIHSNNSIYFSDIYHLKSSVYQKPKEIATIKKLAEDITISQAQVESDFQKIINDAQSQDMDGTYKQNMLNIKQKLAVERHNLNISNLNKVIEPKVPINNEDS